MTSQSAQAQPRSKKHNRFWTGKEMLSSLGYPCRPQTANALGTDPCLWPVSGYCFNIFRRSFWRWPALMFLLWPVLLGNRFIFWNNLRMFAPWMASQITRSQRWVVMACICLVLASVPSWQCYARLTNRFTLTEIFVATKALFTWTKSLSAHRYWKKCPLFFFKKSLSWEAWWAGSSRSWEAWWAGKLKKLGSLMSWEAQELGSLMSWEAQKAGKLEKLGRLKTRVR